MRAWFCVPLVTAVFANKIDVDHVLNITVYHVNPRNAGSTPVNMNTGDALGDLYFYLDAFKLPIECSDSRPNWWINFDCANPERSGDLVVTKLVMEVDDRMTGYSECNLCETGKDPMSGHTCTVGEYVCDCASGELCNSRLVGAQNISQRWVTPMTSAECRVALEASCGDRTNASKTECDTCMHDHWDLGIKQAGCNINDWSNFCPDDEHCTDDPLDAWKCWHRNLARKTGGFWFSHPADAQCKDDVEGLCGWRVLSSTTVEEDCLHNSVIANVEAAGPTCFEGCGDSRNISSTCWIGCFFDTILGPDARHKDTPDAIAGMSREDVSRGWTNAFRPEAQGGCPVLPELTTTTVATTTSSIDVPTESASCKDHPACTSLAPLDGLCCPVADGTRLACCDAVVDVLV